MKKLFLALLVCGSLAAQTIVTNTVYVTNTVVVQSAPVATQTIVYEPSPVYVGPSVVVAPFGFHSYWHPYYHPYYPRPIVSVRIGGYRGHR